MIDVNWIHEVRLDGGRVALVRQLTRMQRMQAEDKRVELDEKRQALKDAKDGRPRQEAYREMVAVAYDLWEMLVVGWKEDCIVERVDLDGPFGPCLGRSFADAHVDDGELMQVIGYGCLMQWAGREEKKELGASSGLATSAGEPSAPAATIAPESSGDAVEAAA